MNFKFIVAFCLLIGAINAVPTQNLPEITISCSKKCLNHENNLFKEIGQTYHYTYETQSQIKLENGQKSQVQLSCKVDVSAISNCEYQMRLRNVQIIGPQEAELMQQQLEQYSTKFSQDYRRIESVCFDQNEASWVENLKKAILSTIQMSVHDETKQIVEKDVLGYCDTKYEKISTNSWQKTKFLNTCTERKKSINSILIGDFNKQKKSTCQIQLDNERQLKSIICEENNSMLLVAHSKSAGKISTLTKLALDKIETSLPEISDKLLIKKSLVFSTNQHSRQKAQNQDEIRKAAEQILHEIRLDTQHNVQKSTPQKIKELSELLAILDIQQLERLAQQVSNTNDKVQDIFFDTIAQTGTKETAHIILKVVLNREFYKDEISKVRKAYWLSMISDIEQVDERILDIALEHFKRDDLPRQVLFALSGMIKSVKDEQKIMQDSRYQKIVSTLVEKLSRANEESEKIAILKALRDTGVHHEVFDKVLNIEKRSRNVETRIAAVQALEQHVNDKRCFEKLMEIFENNSNESELRIAAFQVLVQNQEKARELYDVLRSESNEQVVSYVVSFFKNARESQIPEFETLRRISSSFYLCEKRFERNDFRQSRHIQFTQKSEKLDLSAQVEADLVFDEQKQLRNVRARFDLNKENLKFKSVEVHVRQTGLPEVVQQVIQELTTQVKFDKIVEDVQKLASIRSKDELNQIINKLVKLMNLDKINLSSKRFTDQVDASISVRLQSKTVLYLNLKELASVLEQNAQKELNNVGEQIVDSLIGDNAITLILSNKQHRMPTAYGLPVHSNSSFVMVVALKNEKDAFLPSIATEFNYEMGFTVVKNRSKSALRYHLQMHSAPGLKIKIERKNGVPFKVSVSIPDDRLEVIAIKSFTTLQKINGQVEELNVLQSQRKSCTSVFSKVVGAELCLQAVYPSTVIERSVTNLLFNGLFEFSLHLQKTDLSIRNWQVQFETLLHQSSDRAQVLHFSFDTIGSKLNRKISALVELQNENDSKVLNIDFKAPAKQAKIEARAQFTKEYAGVKAALIMNKQEFEVELGGERTNQNGEQEYRPSMKLIISGLHKIYYQGKILLANSGKKDILQIELKDGMTSRSLFKASAIKSGRMNANQDFKVALDLQTVWIAGSSVRFVSNIGKNSKSASSDLEIIHMVDRQAPTRYIWKFGLQNLSKNEVKKYNANWELNVPSTEFQNISVSWNYMEKENQGIENEIIGFWSRRRGQKERQVHIFQQLKRNQVSAKISSLWENLLKLEIVPLDINYEVQAKTNWKRSQDKYNVQLIAKDVKTNRQYRGELVYRLLLEKRFKMNLEAKFDIEKKVLKIMHDIEEKEKHQYHGSASIELDQTEQVKLNYVYKMKENSLQTHGLNHDLDSSIHFPLMAITFKHKCALNLNADHFELKQSLRKNNAVVSNVMIVLNKNALSQIGVDCELFKMKLDGDMSQKTKKIEILLRNEQYDLTHQTKLAWSEMEKIEIESKTIKSQNQIADILIDYQENQKAEVKVAFKNLGKLFARHQPNSKQWATVEISSDQLSRPIKQNFVVKKSTNKYMINSRTYQDQQIIGEFDLELGSPTFFKIAAFDWKVTGRSVDKKKFNLVLENPKKQLGGKFELELTNELAKFQVKQSNKKRTSILIGQVSTVDESKFEFKNENSNVKILVKPVGQQKYATLAVDVKRPKIQHKSELKYQESSLIVNIKHTNNQKVFSHRSKLSLKEDSYIKTETPRFTVEGLYNRPSTFKLKFTHLNGLEHSTSFELIDARKNLGKILSSTSRNGQEILKVSADVNGFEKVDVKAVHRLNKEVSIQLNLKNQQQFAGLQFRSDRFEVNSKWNQDLSRKGQKLIFEIIDKVKGSKHNLMTEYQRKTMLHLKMESKNLQKSNLIQLIQLKLHRKGEAFFSVDNQNLKLNTKLDLSQGQAQAIMNLESPKHEIKHETIATFKQQENELQITSNTHKNSRKIVDINLTINPATKRIFAVGEVEDKKFTLDGNVNGLYAFGLISKNNEMRHQTELNLNTRKFLSEMFRNDGQLYKINVAISKNGNVEGIAVFKGHEITFKTNENVGLAELNYNNKKTGVRATGQYMFSRELISAKINGQRKSKQIIDLDISLRADQNLRFNSFDGKLIAWETKSSAKVLLPGGKKQMRASVDYENKDKNHEMHFTVDTLSKSENQVSFKVYTENLRIEKEIRLIGGKKIKIGGGVERNGEQILRVDALIEKLFKINGQLYLNTKNLKSQTTLKSKNSDEVVIEFSAEDSQKKKIAAVRSKIWKSNNKVNVNINFGSEKTKPLTLTSEWRKASDQLGVSVSIKSKDENVGKLEGQIRFDGSNLDVKLEGDLIVKGNRKEVVYKLNNLNQRWENVLNIKTEKNNLYGYNVAINSKHSKFVINLPKRTVELGYDVQTQANGHCTVVFNFLPNTKYQPDNIYNLRIDNYVRFNSLESLLNINVTIEHSKIHYPIEIEFRGELREMHTDMPLLIFVSYNASPNQKSRLSGLLTITKESNLRVVHINVNHQSISIFDVYYRWAVHSRMIYQQVNWSVMDLNTQRLTGKLLGHVDLKKRKAQLELDNKLKLQMDWGSKFDDNIIVNIKVQTDDSLRKMEFVTNGNKFEITTYVNKKVTSNYVVSVLKQNNLLMGVEMHEKQGNKLEKVAFIQLAKDSLNYIKFHFKAQQKLIYRVQNLEDHLERKMRSFVKRQVEDARAIIKHQYRNLKVDEKTKNTVKFIQKANDDFSQIVEDCLEQLRKSFPDVFETVQEVYQPIVRQLKSILNLFLEEKIDQILLKIIETLEEAGIKLNEIKRAIEVYPKKIVEQYNELKDDMLNHDVIARFFSFFEEATESVKLFSENKGEEIYLFLHRNLKNFNLHQMLEKIRSIIVNIKNQANDINVRETLHNYIFDGQNLFEGKWNPKGGEVIAKVWYPTRLISKSFY